MCEMYSYIHFHITTNFVFTHSNVLLLQVTFTSMLFWTIVLHILSVLLVKM